MIYFLKVSEIAGCTKKELKFTQTLFSLWWTVLFMRKISGFFPELSWVVPFEKGCTKCKLNWTSMLRYYSLLRNFIV